MHRRSTTRYVRVRTVTAAVAALAGTWIAAGATALPASAATNQAKPGLYKGMTSPVIEPLGLKTERVAVPFEVAVQYEPSNKCGGQKKATEVVDCMRFFSPIGTYGTTSVTGNAHACSNGSHIGLPGAPWAPALQVPADGRIDVNTLLRYKGRPYADISAHIRFRASGKVSGTFRDVVELPNRQGKYNPTCSIGTVTLAAHWVSAKV